MFWFNYSLINNDNEMYDKYKLANGMFMIDKHAVTFNSIYILMVSCGLGTNMIRLPVFMLYSKYFVQ